MVNRLVFFLIVQGLGIVLGYGSVLASAVQPELVTLPPNADPMLVWMQAAGFPAWAGIVAWGVMRITAEIRELVQRLDAHVSMTEHRLTKLETYIGLDAPPSSKPLKDQ